MSFKIIALEVLDSCNSKHSKNLIKDIPYIFYKNYRIKKEKGIETVEIVSEDLDLYSKSTLPKISISAIVGKNGSGKSTLVELLIKVINNLFFKYKKQYLEKNFHPVRVVNGLEANLYYTTNEGIFKLHVFPIKNGTDYIIYKYEKKSSTNYVNPREVSIFDLNDFFYTEVINYSLYAYNSNPKHEGNWITKIFHKNDAYQTPVVLNPYREEGIIDINKENDLVYQRLLANLLRYDADKKLNLNLGDNLEASQLILELSGSDYYVNKSKYDFNVDLLKLDDLYGSSILNSLFIQFFGNIIQSKVDEKLLQLSKLYILYKLISICHKYEEYKQAKFFDRRTKKFGNVEELTKKLKKDNSHITFKLRQILNYLKYNHIKFDSFKTLNKVEFKIIAKEVESVSNKEKCNLINFLPPPIFRTDIQLSSVKSLKKGIKFSTLSSGEKQQIYSSSSIYYHLINLDSVVNSSDDKKISYKYINILLEEIELYFHPEFQRVFIDRILKGIKNLNLKNIEGINLLFVTHSPFILSDIPHTNIMYLSLDEKGYSTIPERKKKSFASNIHHLLGDNFFFEDGVFIGEFAKSKITDIINFINKNEKNGNENENENVEYNFKLIQLIDEPILRSKLMEMLFKKFPEFHKQKNIDEKEAQVKHLAEQLGVNINIIKDI